MSAGQDKVLVLAISYADFGGIQRLLRSVVAQLRTDAAVVQVVSHRDPVASPDPAVHGCGRSRVRLIATAVRQLVRGSRTDVLVVGHVMLMPLAVLALVRRPRRIVLLTYGIEVWDRPGRVKRALVKLADVIVSISSHTEQVMRDTWGIPAERFARLVITASAPRRAPAAGAEAPTLLVVSRLDTDDRQKYVDRVILAMVAIRRSSPGARLRIIGDGDWRQELEQLARDAGVDDLVEFSGAVDDTERDAAYRAASVFVLPSTIEGFGIVYLEAWLHGLPVIAGNDGAAPEIVRDGVDGFCVPPDPLAIAESARRLLEDPALRSQLAASGAERAETTFGADAFARSVATALLGAA